MATLAQIRERVSRKIQDENNTAQSASVVDYEINRAVRFYSRYRFWFNEKMADLTLTSGTQAIPSVPSDNVSVLRVNGIMLIDDQVKITLTYLLPDEFFSRDDDQTGRPYYYTLRNGEYLLLPTPNEAFPIKFRYLQKYADLVNDSDTNDFTDNAEELLMLHATKNLYAEDKNDPTYAVALAELERAELAALMKQTSDQISTGCLDINPLLDDNYI